MKILIGADTYAPDINGASKFAQRLAAALGQDHEVHVLCPSTDRQNRVGRTSPAPSVPRGVQVHRIASLPVGVGTTGLRICPQPWLARTAKNFLRTLRPDVVHVQGHFFIGRALLTAARRLGIPTVATNHFMPENLTHYLPVPRVVERFVHRQAWRDAAKVLTGADVVTTPTTFAARLAEANGVPLGVRAISCGMDLARFASGSGEWFRRRYGIAERPTIGYVGRLAREKNVHELVQALAVVRYRLDAQLLLVGDGDEAKHLRDLARHLGVEDAVVFTGFVRDADLPSAYAAMDVFVNAGTAELQSLVTLEAMAAGLPVLGVAAGALPHLVRDDVNGYLFPHAQPHTLALRMEEVLQDPALQADLGRGSVDLAGAHDLQLTVDAFSEIYRSAVRQVTGFAALAA